MPQQRKQMTQTIFSTGFPLSFFFLSQTRSAQGKLPVPFASTERRLCCSQNPTVPGIIQWDGRMVPISTCSQTPVQSCFHSNNTTATTLHPAQLIPNTCWPELPKIEHLSGINIPPFPKCEHTERGHDSHKVTEQVRASRLRVLATPS